MLDRINPGVYISGADLSSSEPLPFAITGFVGIAARGPLNLPQRIRSWEEFQQVFGECVSYAYLAKSVYGFFLNGGEECYVVRVGSTSISSIPPAQTTTDTYLREPVTTAKNVYRINDYNTNETIKLQAINEGSWGNQISYEIVDGTQLDMQLATSVAMADVGQKHITVSNIYDFEPDMKIQIKATHASITRIPAVVQNIQRASHQLELTQPLPVAIEKNAAITGMGFKLRVSDGITTEIFDNLSMSQDHPRYFTDVINGPQSQTYEIDRYSNGHSLLIKATHFNDPPAFKPQRLANLKNKKIQCFYQTGSRLYVGTEDGLYVSEDDAQTWRPVRIQNEPIAVYTLTQHSDYLIIGTANGIYSSNDDGLTWQARSFGLTNTHITTLISNASTLYCGTPAGIFKSEDNGDNWSICNQGLGNLSINCLAVSGSTVFAGTASGLYHSNDNGITWALVESLIDTPVINSIEIDGATIVVGTSLGLHVSDNNGTEWTHDPVLATGIPVFSVAIISNDLFAATQQGLFRYNSTALVWSPIKILPSASSVREITQLDTTLYAALAKGIYKSIDGGESWFAANGERRLTGGYDGFAYASTALNDEIKPTTLRATIRSDRADKSLRGSAGNDYVVVAEPYTETTTLNVPKTPTDDRSHIHLTSTASLVVGDTFTITDVADDSHNEPARIASVISDHEILVESDLGRDYPVGARITLNNRFNLHLYDPTLTHKVASHHNLSFIDGDARFVSDILNANHSPLCVDVVLPPSEAPKGKFRLVGGADPGQIDYRYYTGYDGEGHYFQPTTVLAAEHERLFGLANLEAIDDVALIAVPDLSRSVNVPNAPTEQPSHYLKAIRAIMSHCRVMGDRLAIIDTEAAITSSQQLLSVIDTFASSPEAGYGVVYQPWLVPSDDDNHDPIPPSGYVAGLMARSDRLYGVVKAPANLPVLKGVVDVTNSLSEDEQSRLYANGINTIGGLTGSDIQLSGARTLSSRAQEQLLNVRRTILGIKRILSRKLMWAVFEPNSTSLLARIESSLLGFLQNLSGGGMLQANLDQEAFYVKCDKESNAAAKENEVYAEIGLSIPPAAELIRLTVRRTPETISIVEPDI